MGRTFLMDVHKRMDRTMIYGDEWKQHIAQNNLIGGEYITFSLKETVNGLRTLYFSSQDDEVDEDDQDDQDQALAQDDHDDGDNQDDEDDEDLKQFHNEYLLLVGIS